MTFSDFKWLILAFFLGRWRRPHLPVDGYTILLPSPMDMPFLLRFALEGLRHLDTSNCRQIVVIPDGVGGDRAAALLQVVDSCGDSRVQLAHLRAGAHFVVHGIRRSGGEIANWTHWAMIVEGINRAKCDYIFLHDADAFFLESDGLERLYRECRDREMATVGVAARWDPFFRKTGYAIPGTYELMFSARWIRRYVPLDLKARRRQTMHGSHVFDTMLYPQFEEYHTAKVGVLDPPPQLVHFAGAITQYREFCDRAGQPVVDEYFRLLFLALMEDLFPSPIGYRLLPSISALAEGLNNPAAHVTYDSPRATSEYSTFRAMIEDLCKSPIFFGPRAKQIRASIYRFDSHYEKQLAATNRTTDGRFKNNTIEPKILGSGLADKRLQLLSETIPTLSRLAVLSNPSNSSHSQALRQLQAAALSRGIDICVAQASSPESFGGAFVTVITGRADALIVLADGMFFDNHLRIVSFTDINRLPTLFFMRESAEAGGLMAYGPYSPVNLTNEPGLTIEPRFALTLNLNTARVLGLTFPTTILAAADEVIK